LNGTNYVNSADAGREVQAAQFGDGPYDDCCAGSFGWGWNPVQAGDKYSHGSPVLSQVIAGDSLYVKTQGYEWNPDDKGGGPDLPVLGDTYVEAHVSAVTRHANTFQVHYKVTHFGADQHANSFQELPAVYVNLGYDRLAAYAGMAPWTNATVSIATPTQPSNFAAAEEWAAYIDGNDLGLTVFVPGVAPYVAAFTAAGDPGPTGSGTNYFAPYASYTFGPGSVLERDVYLIAGDYKHARQVVYDIHNEAPSLDIFTPFGAMDDPAVNSQLTGTTSVAGWAIDNVAVSRVDVYVDQVRVGSADYGEPRPDVVHDFPNAPAGTGYRFSLDTRRFDNGAHNVEVKVLDVSGNLAAFPPSPVTIQN
jgi:hypothetical protein